MKLHFLLPVIFLAACGENQAPAPASEPAPTAAKTIGKIERMSPELDAILDADAQIEVLAEGYTWSEGPVWVASGGYLLFTDVPENKIYKWKEGEGASLYLTPSGFTGEATTSTEPGGNGLTLDANGSLIVCQHGDRRVARMAAPLDQPKPSFETLADKWNGKRLNSPNDLVFDKMGNLYFTDPPYGLKDHDKRTEKEIPFQGVYLRTTDGKVTLLDSTLTRPNGVALSADGKLLFVANSDPAKAMWKVYDVQPDGKVANGRSFHDATASVGETLKGLPDGMKVGKNGTVFASGPGGILIFKLDGTLLGRINPGEATANCAFGADEKVLYLTSDMYLCRVKLKG